MGYYTNYQLSIISGDDYTTDYEKEISELAGYDYCFGESIKWYCCEDDMRVYSTNHPQVLFLLEGEGDENDDVWRAYFQDGKMFKTKVKLVFEEFSIEKLQ
jgi:hypothetical protein